MKMWMLLSNNHALSDKSVDGQDDHGHSDSGGSVVDLPLCDLDDKSFHNTVDDLEDSTQGQDQHVTENNGYEEIKKKRFIGKEFYLVVIWNIIYLGQSFQARNTDVGLIKTSYHQH